MEGYAISAPNKSIKKLYHRFRLCTRLGTRLLANVESERKKSRGSSSRREENTLSRAIYIDSKIPSRDTPFFILSY